MHVSDLMTTDVLTVGPDTPLTDVARLLVERRISGLPVVDTDGRVLGIISEADFVTKEGGVDDRARSPLAWLLGSDDEERQRVAARTAGEGMTAPAHTIEPDRPVSEAARTMSEHRINRLPVVTDGRLVGILTRADIVRAFARTDHESFTAVAEVVRPVDGLRLLGVDDGVARLAGTVASEEVARTTVRLVREVDGIVAVDDHEVDWPESPEIEHVPGWTGYEPGMGPGSRSS